MAHKKKPAPKNTAVRHRLQLDLTPEALEQLDEITEMDGAPTRAAVVRNALRYYRWLLEHDRAGSEMIVRDSSGRETILKLVW